MIHPLSAMSSDTSLREGGSDVGARRNVRPQRTKRKVDYSYSDYEATMKESIIPDLYRPPRKRKRGNDNSPYWHPIEVSMFVKDLGSVILI
jgi:hypothetical protein